jgi:hypothetical protein
MAGKKAIHTLLTSLFRVNKSLEIQKNSSCRAGIGADRNGGHD